MRWQDTKQCDFCSRRAKPDELTPVVINPRPNLAVDYSDRMAEILERRENKEWVFEDRAPTWDRGEFPMPEYKSYNRKMVKLSVVDMMDIFEESIQMHDDGEIEVCEHCVDVLK